MIPFNKPPFTGEELTFISEAFSNEKLCGDGPFGKKCEEWIKERFNAKHVLLTPSCTAALEMAAILVGIVEGDEVIMPSYTFVSTANAFILRGAKVVFVDVNPKTMNIDESKIVSAITNKTKAIVPVHYAGVSCNMDKVMEIADEFGLWVIEDAAQGVMSSYRERSLGTIGHIGCYSFHETKNYTSGGEGGAIIIQDESLIEKANIIREKGTNRHKFLQGQVDKYTWVNIGSSFLPSELQAAFLFSQLQNADKINESRLKVWLDYYERLSVLEKRELLELPFIPDFVSHNAHMFFIKVRDASQRQSLLSFLKQKGIQATFHYVPLHSSPYGAAHCSFHGQDQFTSDCAGRLIRLPIWYNMPAEDVCYVADMVLEFFADE
ncbi:MAG: dTDP-4-amino-4,6-dideoxygalactose transaminase [Oceanospirillaceae bacterium]|nr:dTDP-4-amino-4,6-dideoxygalactose transaminase [Oceanospirillaceae bacterium]